MKPTMYFHLKIVFLMLVALTFVVTVRADESKCLESLEPNSSVRGINELKPNQPLYHLHFDEHFFKDSHVGHSQYRVHVSSKDPLRPFQSVKITADTIDACGAGEFVFSDKDYTDNKDDQCTYILETATDKATLDTPSLTWRPPFCGCVHFRVQVVDQNNVYYMDAKSTKNGQLSQTVCVKERLTRSHYMEAMCTAINLKNAQAVIDSPAFLSRHGLDAKTMDKFNLLMDMEFRRTHNIECCQKKNLADRLECLGDNRRRRIDKFCAYGTVDIPFATFRNAHMRNRESHCCYHLGEHRYKCFSEKSEITKETINATYLDYSLDDTDPVNDLADFTTDSKDHEVVKLLKSVVFHTQPKNADTTNDQPVREDLGHKIKIKIPGGSSRESDYAGDRPSASLRNSLSTSEEESPKTLNRDSIEKKIKSRGSAEKKNIHREQSVGLERKLKPRTSSERKSTDKYFDEFSEKNTKSLSSAEKKVGSVDYYGSKERKKKERSSGEKKVGVLDSMEGDYLKDDLEGGSSVEKTLKKIKRQIERLRLKSQCCEAGERSGTSVFSRTAARARKECDHSAGKYIQRLRLEYDNKMCINNFISCCVETSASPKMSSSEFQRSPFMNYNKEDTDLDFDNEPEVEDVQPDNGDEDDEEQKELETDKGNLQVNGQVNTEGKNPPVNDLQEDDEEDNLNGPQIFDAADNDEDFERTEVLSRDKPKGEDNLDNLEDEMVVEDVQMYETPLRRESPKMKPTLRGEKLHQSKLRTMANTKKSQSSRTGGVSRIVKKLKERSSRMRRTSSERVQGHEGQTHWVKGQVPSLDSGEMMAMVKKKALKKTMDSKEMEVLVTKDDERIDLQGGRSRLSRRHIPKG
ncbi:uncharacterized protein LOC106052649 [Biomphalaria glabrata]|uniref:Uncharacterized protein LOC106052649 n=1 Tax=Biomphalaria glabrata TaxID=6526 RepID=A0A9U8DVQ7_BIOGL|nr:uncharacterized protein LOC106052649 [Biomphalaria glabrata]